MKIITLMVLVFLGSNVSFAQATTTASSSEPIVEVRLFTRKLFDRTEYVLGIKNTDFKNLSNDKLDNELQNLNTEQKNLVVNSLKNLKSNSTTNLLKSTDPQIVKIVSQKNILSKHKEDAKYFKNYKVGSYNIGFVSTLSDKSIVVLGDFKESNGESKMFGMILSKYNGKYYINSIYSGETSLLASFPPEPNKDPIVVSNPVNGFTTKNLDKLDASTLVPNNWFYRYEENNGSQAYFISEQEIKKDTDIFETGFTMNVNYQQSVPDGDAVKFIDTYLSKIKVNGKIEKSTSGETEIYIYKQIVGIFNDNDYKYKMAVRVIANKKTNTLYILMFESPLKKWDNDWNTKGKAIFDYLTISR